MVFDENISLEFSLPRVLDHFIKSGEDPWTILHFLDSHSDEILDIMKYSDCSPRIFSLDFIMKMTPQQNEMFANILKTKRAWLNDGEIYDLLCQIRTFTEMDETRKNIYRKLADALTFTIKYGPYSGKRGSECLKLERRFFEAKDPADYAVILDEMSPNDIVRLLNLNDKTTILPRLYQEDVFIRLKNTTQFIMLNNFPDYATIQVLKGLKQIVTGCSDVEVKKMACDVLYHYNDKYGDNLASFIGKSIDEGILASKTFNQMAMKIEICGKDCLCDWILFYVLVKFGLNFMKKGANGHKRLFEENFDILDILYEK